MTRKFEISNAKSGHLFGVYEADTPEAALNAFAREAGYQDYDHAQRIAPASEGELSCIEIQ